MAETKTKEKKTGKKTAVKAKASVNKSNTVAEQLKQLRQQGIADLDKALSEAKTDLKKAQKSLKAGELPASHVIKQLKSKIARIHTVMTEKKNNKEEK